jgi:hypothetical protein
MIDDVAVQHNTDRAANLHLFDFLFFPLFPPLVLFFFFFAAAGS